MDHIGRYGAEGPKALPLPDQLAKAIVYIVMGVAPPSVDSEPLAASELGKLGGLRAVTRRRLCTAQNNEKGSLKKPLLHGGAKMTAEVAILNKAAVALAADSKVTIGSGGNEKTYDSVNKIFTLSKRHPVGIMVYGNADFMGYPWETVIKLYRHDVADKPYSSITDWAKSFQRFLRGFGSISKSAIQQNVSDILRATFGDVEQQALYVAHLQSVGIPSAEYEKILIGRLEAQAKEITAEGPWLVKRQAREPAPEI
jgi:hypothetical protein